MTLSKTIIKKGKIKMELTDRLEESEYVGHFVEHFYGIDAMLERRAVLIKQRSRYENAQHSGEFDYVIRNWTDENGRKPSETDRCLILNDYTNPLYDEVDIRIRDLEGNIKAEIDSVFQEIIDELRGDWDALKSDIFNI